MKIVIFEPHPDDLLFGPGPLIFNWIEEGHEIHVITVTDGRACYIGNEEINMSESVVSEMRLNEARKAVDFLGLPLENLHLLKYPDAKARKHVKQGIEEVKPLLKEVDRIVLPSNHNKHRDHQATHNIAMGAAQALQLTAIEYLVYFIHSYGKFKDDSKEKQFEFPISDTLREKLFSWLEIYQSQKKVKYSWKMYLRFLKFLKIMTYGIFSLDDKGKYYNF